MQHGFSILFYATLQNKLLIFVARFPTALRQPSVHCTLTTDERGTWVYVARALSRLARRYLKIYVIEINKNRLNTCVVACAYHVYHSVAKRLSSNPVPRFRPKNAGGKRSRKSCFPARVGCLAWKLERFYPPSGILHQGAPEPRIAFLPSLVSAWETFHVKNYAPRALALSAWHEREPADRKQNIQRRAWKSKWGWQLSIFVQFPAQSTCPLEAIIMADKADSQDLKSKAKEIAKVSRNHYESLK